MRAIDVSRGYVRTAAARDRARCDPCRLDDVDARLAAKAGSWFVTVVRPQSEFRAVDRMDLDGIFAFTPVTWRHRAWNANTARTWRAFPKAPGYVLSCLDDVNEQWGQVVQNPDVRFVIQPHGALSPVPVSTACVEVVRAFSERASKHRAPPPKIEFHPGEWVTIEVGPFADFKGRVAALRGDEARIAMRILGVEREVSVSLSSVKKVAP